MRVAWTRSCPLSLIDFRVVSLAPCPASPVQNLSTHGIGSLKSLRIPLALYLGGFHSDRDKMRRGRGANVNQVLIDDDTEQFYCRPCERWFNTGHGALSHCRSASRHRDEWCETCQWLFVSPGALNDHLANSSNHHFCESCNEDFDGSSELSDHNADVHHQRPDNRRRYYGNNSVQQVLTRHLGPWQATDRPPVPQNLPAAYHRMFRLL